MVELTMQLPDSLAERINPIRRWLPTILEMGLVGFKTSATETAAELIEFLESEPTPIDVYEFHVSDRAQERLMRLLALNNAGLLGKTEQRELDELERIEHIVIMLKAQVATELQAQPNG